MKSQPLGANYQKISTEAHIIHAPIWQATLQSFQQPYLAAQHVANVIADTGHAPLKTHSSISGGCCSVCQAHAQGPQSEPLAQRYMPCNDS